jgi:hypothetical protein
MMSKSFQNIQGQYLQIRYLHQIEEEISLFRSLLVDRRRPDPFLSTKFTTAVAGLRNERTFLGFELQIALVRFRATDEWVVAETLNRHLQSTAKYDMKERLEATKFPLSDQLQSNSSKPGTVQISEENPEKYGNFNRLDLVDLLVS